MRSFRIGEVAQRTGLTRRTLRHYDELGLLIPSGRSEGDYRLYSEADLLRLLQVQSLKALGLSLAEIRAALADPHLDASTTLRSHLAELRARLDAEQRLASQLERLARSDQRSWEDVLDAVALTQRLAHADPMVRFRAALTAGTRTTAELLAALTVEDDQAVQEILIWALAQQPDAEAPVIAAVDQAGPELRCRLARLLGKLNTPATRTTLRQLAADADPDVAHAASVALGDEH